MSRGDNRSYIILALDEDDPEWLGRFIFSETTTGDDPHVWYRIPLVELAKRWRGVSVHSGSLAVQTTTAPP